MAIPHAKPGEIIDLRPLGGALATAQTQTLIKTDSLEVLRIVITAGKKLPPHRVAGEITVHCLEGHVIFDAEGTDHELLAGDLLFLRGGTPHALHAVKDSSLLVTILLYHKSPATGT